MMIQAVNQKLMQKLAMSNVISKLFSEINVMGLLVKYYARNIMPEIPNETMKHSKIIEQEND